MSARVRRYLFTLAALSVTLLLGVVMTARNHATHLAEERERARMTAVQSASALALSIEQALVAAQVAEAHVQLDPELSGFGALAQELLGTTGGLVAIELAPGATVTEVHASDGLQDRRGLHLLGAETPAIRALETRDLVLEGPVARGDRPVLRGYLPVFLRDDDYRRWGLVVAVVDLGDMLEAAGFSTLAEDGWAWQLTRAGPDGYQHVAGGAGDEAEHYHVEIVGTKWRITVSPSAGWLASRRGSTLELTAWALVALAFSLVVSELMARTTDERSARQQLADSEARYALAAKGANDGLWDWNRETGRVYLSRRWKEMLGYADDELDDSLDEWFDRLHPDDLDHVRQELDGLVYGDTPKFESEYRARTRAGEYRWFLSRAAAIRSPGGLAMRIAGSQTDITDWKRVEERLHRDAYYDALTGLANRQNLHAALESELTAIKARPDHLFALLFLDLDRFKWVNDSLGHAVGDLFLEAVARRLERCTRPGDVVARLGGDEFCIVLRRVGTNADVIHVAERIKEALAEPMRLDGRELHTTASIGIAFGSPEYASADDILRDADTAMYRAKQQGKARFVVFDQKMHAAAVARLALELDLRHALKRDEFELDFQPIVDIRTGRVVAVEALLRWQNPRRGRVLPGAFLHVAEEIGVMVEIGTWVVGEACRHLRLLRDRHPSAADLRMSVNIAGRQFDEGLVDVVLDALRAHRLPGRALHLEMTESVLMQDADRATQVLELLRAHDLRVHVDDFGTGYSSLAHLQRLPIDALKVDRSFVSRLDEPGGREFVRTICALGQSLNLPVIAEGVESHAHQTALTALGCTFAQGSQFHDPLRLQQLESLLSGLEAAAEAMKAGAES